MSHKYMQTTKYLLSNWKSTKIELSKWYSSDFAILEISFRVVCILYTCTVCNFFE